MSSNSLRQVTALIVGGGPVARIIGKHLKLSGIDDIGLLLKPKYAPIADQGFELHQLLTLKKKRLRQRYDDFKIIPSVETLARVHFDQIYICVSGPELRTGWLEQAWPHLRHSVWITFTPGVDDYEYMAQTIPERYIVRAIPGFIAYEAPLPSENINPPGIAYWFPPGQMTYFKGHDEDTTTMITRQFDRGGFPAGSTSTFDGDRLYESAAMTCAAAALEIHNWNFEALLNDRSGMARLCVTQGEIGNAIMARYGTDSKLNRRLRSPFWWKLALKYLDGFCPFPLPEYMASHFTKHRRQMEQQFGDFVKLVKAFGVDPTGTQSLARDWARRRPAVAERSMDHLLPMGMVANTAVRSVFSETGELGGEAKGKNAADAKGVPIAAHASQSNQQLPARPGSDPKNPTQPVQQQHVPGQPGQPQQYQGHPTQPTQPYPQQGHPQQQHPQQGHPQQGHPQQGHPQYPQHPQQQGHPQQQPYPQPQPGQQGQYFNPQQPHGYPPPEE